MQHRRSWRALALIGTLAIVGSLLGTAGAAQRPGRTDAPIRFVRHVRALGDLPRTRIAPRRSAGDALDAELYRLHNREGAEFEGGEAVRDGEVAAPTRSRSVHVTGPAAGDVSWQGLNHFDSRYSGGGNQFSGEPPDQGLCASNTRVFEMVNSVVQVYTTSGDALIDGTPFFPGTEPVGITLNEFFGQPPAFVRPDGPFGPFTFDVSCKYDPGVSRWFVTAEFLEQDETTGAFAGPGGFFLAASTSANPLGGWDVWSIDTTNNGENGTPDHGCTGGFCFGDYPQLGIDRFGVFVTTNEFALFGADFNGAQLYAFSKADLVSGDATPNSQTFENVFSEAVGDVAYTLQPVDSLAGQRDGGGGGRMYFGMSHSPFIEGNATAISLWRLSNTSSLDDDPDLSLEEASTATRAYSVPGFALQKAGPTPLLDCVNSRSCIGASYPHQDSPLPLDAGNSGKVYGAWRHQGVVYLAYGTNLAGAGGASFSSTSGKWKAIDIHTGVSFVGLQPSSSGPFSVKRVQQGTVDVSGQNITFPSLAIRSDGTGAIGVTLVGPNRFPSAAYLPFEAGAAPGAVVVPGPGVGPNDGFTATGEGDFDPRWGDYAAAVVSPNGTVWLANEYIAQRCGVAAFTADDTCGFTRTFFANWSTRVTGLPAA